MITMYSSDRELTDLTLTTVIQFIFRRLSSVLDTQGNCTVSPTCSAAIQQLLSTKNLLQHTREALQTVISCLCMRDMQIVLAYVWRQSQAALAANLQSAAAEGGSECSTASHGSQVRVRLSHGFTATAERRMHSQASTHLVSYSKLTRQMLRHWLHDGIRCTNYIESLSSSLNH